MADLLEHDRIRQPSLPPAPARAPDEGAARRTLLHQVARIESELGALFCSAFPRKGLDFRVASRGGGPRVLDLAELEQLRDDLAERLAEARRQLHDRTHVEEQNRRRLERMMLEPERYPWERVTNEEIGERGCTSYEVRPKLGLIGMALGWWRVVISSGCPLPGGGRRRPPA